MPTVSRLEYVTSQIFQDPTNTDSTCSTYENKGQSMPTDADWVNALVRLEGPKTLWSSEIWKIHTQRIKIQTSVSTSHWDKIQEKSLLTYPFHPLPSSHPSPFTQLAQNGRQCSTSGVSNSWPGGQLRPAGWYFVAPYLTSKFSVSAARTLFSNAPFCWVLPRFYFYFFITYGLP